ncbi:MAG TPA: hypothetical protein VF146_13615 [Bryobacteraceae bacterium]
MENPRSIRWLFYAAVAFVAAATLAMNIYTFFQIARARTNVPWWDEWARIGELRRIGQGEAVFPVLWSSDAGGIRTVVLRLVVLANQHGRALRSLTFASLGIHGINVFLLLAMIVRLIGRAGFAWPVLVCAVVLNLAFHPIQMENFVWSGQIQYFLTYSAAAGSIALLVFSNRRAAMLAGSLALALLSSYSMTNGLLIWPVLVGVGVHLRFTRAWLITFAVTGSLVIATYFLNYQGPSIGMGVTGMLREPLHAIALVGLVLAGPLSFISTPAGIGLALAALCVLTFVAVQVLHKAPPREAVFLIASACFLLLSCAAMVAGRLDPRFLKTPAGLFTLQSRHYTPVFLFWATSAPLVAFGCWQSSRRPVLLAVFALILGWLIFAEPRRQLNAAEDWADFFVGVDAAGLAMLLNIPDEPILSKLWPIAPERSASVDFLRQRHLALFSDGRAAWAGRKVGEIFRGPAAPACLGGIEQVQLVANGSWRLQGWALDERGQTPRDLIFADRDGQIVGIARGGFRHNYFPGLIVEPLSPPASLQHQSARHSEWLGYVRQPGRAGPDVTLYGVLARNRICLVESWTR